MFSQQMIRLFGVVLERDREKVTETLLREGVLHFINMTTLKRDLIEKLQDIEPRVALAKVMETRQRVESFLAPHGLKTSLPEDMDFSGVKSTNIEKENRSIDELTEKMQVIRDRQHSVQQEILKFEDIRRQIEMYGVDFTQALMHSQYSFIALMIGKIRAPLLQRLNDGLRDLPCVAIPVGEERDTIHLLVVSMKRDKDRIEKVLSAVSWEPVEMPDELKNIQKDVAQDLSVKIEQLSGQQVKLQKESMALVEENRAELEAMWIRLRISELFFTIQSYYKRSSRTIIFTGWLPRDKQHTLASKLSKTTQGTCYLEWIEPKDSLDTAEGPGNAPVQLRNPRIFAPFQMLVTNFGIPEYGTIDPTPVIFLTYLCMFGLMFADAGQGFVLALLGLLGRHFLGNKIGLKKLAELLIWCGGSAVLFGILFGSYFGMSWFKPLWFDFHGIIAGHTAETSAVSNVFDILNITIYFGITVIGLGLVFNWINLVLKRKWTELVLDKGGILGGWIYCGGIYTARYMVQHGYRELPSSVTLFWLLGLPALLFYFKGPAHFFGHRSHSEPKKLTAMTLMDWSMEWIVELLEVFTGYLSNTLSFMRVAGLGFAHASLMIAFFSLARMASGGQEGLFNLWSIFILLLGNVLVIGLEGLSAGIQALRLHYYEFFTKFFHGTGKLYSPVSLIKRD